MRARLDGTARGSSHDKWYGMARIGVNAALRVAFAVTIARLAGPEGFAVFVGLVTVEVLGLTLLSAGWITPFGSIGPRLDQAARSAFLGFALARTLRACVGIGLLLAAATPIARFIAGVPVGVQLAFAASTTAWLASTSAATALATRFDSRIALFAQGLAAVGPITALALAAVGEVGSDVLLAFFVGNAVGHGAASWAMLRVLPRGGGEVDAGLRDEVRAFGRVVLTGSVANSACTRVQPFVLAAVGGAGAIALFGAANTLVGPARVLAGALGEVLRPRLSLHQGVNGDSRRARRALGLGVGALGAMGVAMLGLFTVAGEPIAALVFGDGFEGLGRILPWAALFVLIAAVVHVLVVAMQTLSLAGTAAATRARVVVAAASLAAVWPACAWDGARGAFVAMAFGEVVFLVVALRFLACHGRPQATVVGLP